MAVKFSEIIFSLWVKKSSIDLQKEIKNWVRKSLGFSEKIVFEYKPHPA